MGGKMVKIEGLG